MRPSPLLGGNQFGDQLFAMGQNATVSAARGGEMMLDATVRVELKGTPGGQS